MAGGNACAQAVSYVAGCLQMPLTASIDPALGAMACPGQDSSQAVQILGLSCPQIRAAVTDAGGRVDDCMWLDGLALLQCVAFDAGLAAAGWEAENQYWAAEAYTGVLCSSCTEDPCARRCQPGHQCIDFATGLCSK